MLPGLGKAVGEAQTTALHEVLANQKKDFKVTLLLPVENSVWGGLWDWVNPRSEAASTAKPQNTGEGTSLLWQEGGEGPEASVYS